MVTALTYHQVRLAGAGGPQVVLPRVGDGRYGGGDHDFGATARDRIVIGEDAPTLLGLVGEDPVWGTPAGVRLSLLADRLVDPQGTTVAGIRQPVRGLLRALLRSGREPHRRALTVTVSDGTPWFAVSHRDYTYDRLPRRARRQVDLVLMDATDGTLRGAIRNTPDAPRRYTFTDPTGRVVGGAVEEQPRDLRTALQAATDTGAGRTPASMVLLRVALYGGDGGQVGWLDKSLPIRPGALFAGIGSSYGTGWRLELAPATPEPLETLCVALLCTYEKIRPPD